MKTNNTKILQLLDDLTELIEDSNDFCEVHIKGKRTNIVISKPKNIDNTKTEEEEI